MYYYSQKNEKLVTIHCMSMNMNRDLYVVRIVYMHVIDAFEIYRTLKNGLCFYMYILYIKASIVSVQL